MLSSMAEIFIQPSIVGVDTATSASGAVTIDSILATITTESLTTAAAAEYTLTVTDKLIGANSIILPTAGKGTSTQGTPIAGGVTVSAGQAIIVITNAHASEAFNGTLKISFYVLNPGI